MKSADTYMYLLVHLHVHVYIYSQTCTCAKGIVHKQCHAFYILLMPSTMSTKCQIFFYPLPPLDVTLFKGLNPTFYAEGLNLAEEMSESAKKYFCVTSRMLTLPPSPVTNCHVLLTDSIPLRA